MVFVRLAYIVTESCLENLRMFNVIKRSIFKRSTDTNQMTFTRVTSLKTQYKIKINLLGYNIKHDRNI